MQAFHYMLFGAMQQIESIHANGEMEEVKEQKKLEKNPTMQQVLLHDPDFTLNIKMLNQYSNNYCIMCTILYRNGVNTSWISGFALLLQ